MPMENRKSFTKKILNVSLILLVVSLCGLTVYGVIWVRQYQALVDEESDIVLSPNVVELTYCTINGSPLKLDLYFPIDTQTPWQVLVYVHGGSFTSGDKRKGSGIIDIPAMIARGFAVAAINYRLMPDHPFPAEIIDAKCAIRFLRAHASEYNLRTEKIGIWGGSAGGIKIFESKNVSVKILKKLIDIDTKEDLVCWHREKKDELKHPVKIFADSIKDLLIE